MTERGAVSLMPNRERVREEAAHWVAKLDSRPSDPKVLAAFEEWIAISAMHRAEFARLASIWRDFDQLDDLNFIYPFSESGSDNSGTRAWLGASLAGTIAASMAFLIFFYWGSETNEQSILQLATYSTSLGEQKTISLFDETSVVLNTNSKIRVRYDNDSRIVELLKGEAFFKIKKDTDKPFMAFAGASVVRATGTAFSVRVDDQGRLDVVVTEGSVDVLQKKQAFAALEFRAEEALQVAQLEDGERITVSDAGAVVVATIDQTALDRKLAWRQGKLAFSGEPLREVVEEMGRYTDHRIDILDPSLEGLPVGGFFNAGEVEGFLDALEVSFGVEVVHISDKHAQINSAVNRSSSPNFSD